MPFLAYTTVFLLLPAGTVIVGAFQTQDGGWSFDNIQTLFQTEPYRTAFKNSIEVSIVTALVGGRSASRSRTRRSVTGRRGGSAGC